MEGTPHQPVSFLHLPSSSCFGRIHLWFTEAHPRKCRGSCGFSLSVVPDSVRPHGLQPTRLLCPWAFPGKNTGVGCHFFSRGSSWYRDRTQVSCIAGGFCTTEPPGKPQRSWGLSSGPKIKNEPPQKKPCKMCHLLLGCFSDYTAIERMCFSTLGLDMNAKRTSRADRSQVTNPGLPGVMFFFSILFSSRLVKSLQLTVPPEVLFLKAALKLFTSCKNKCDLHLIWVITFTVN